jgi:ESCRT-I complex subunit TSG101
MNLNTSNSLPKSASLPAIATMPYPAVSTPPTRTGTVDSSSNTNANTNGNYNSSNNYSLQELLYRKVADKLQQYNVSVSGDMDKLLLQNRQLNEGELSIEQEYRALCDIKERLKYNNMVLETRSKEIDEVTEKVNAMPDVQVDEALCGTTVVANQ